MSEPNDSSFGWGDRLREGLAILADRAPHDPDLTSTIHQKVGRRRRRPLVLIATASVGVVVGTVLVAGAIRGEDPSPAPDSPGVTDASYACPAHTPVAVVPAWARAGFSEPRPEMPFVVGNEGRMVAILFGEPLTAPRSADHANKVLWVPKEDSGALTVNARLAEGATPTVIELPAPGPSYLDLPKPGCWHLELSWGAQSDTMNIRVHTP